MPRRLRRKKSERPPPARRSAPTQTPKGRAARAGRARQLLYKVVELSTVDEHSIESTVNEWVRQGWNLDGVQFAMRESSKRPSMAFVFFTRDDVPVAKRAPSERENAADRLRRLALEGPTHSAATSTEESAGAAAPAALEPDAELHPFRELDPAELERASDERIWPSRPERSTNAWQRLQELANEADDEDSES